MNTLVGLVTTVLTLSVCVVLAYVGLQRGMLMQLREDLHRAKKQFPTTDSCEILHDTAAMEVEVYGKIVSQSVADHMAKCKINYKAIESRPQTRPDNCLHEWGEQHTVDGKYTACCKRCGTMRQYRFGGVVS